MRGVYLSGRRTVHIEEVDRPAPGPGQVLIRMRASTICGSALRAIYRQHPGACVACGFATAYEALSRTCVSGRDAVMVSGLSPVGVAAGLLARAMGADAVFGVDPVASRRVLAEKLGAADAGVRGKVALVMA